MLSRPALKQLLVATSPLLAALSVGGMVGYPKVLLQQLQDNSTSPQIDFETASWIGSLHGFAAIPSVLISVFMQIKGRKLSFQISCLLVAVGWILAYTATSATTILISESFHGLGSQCMLIVSTCSMTEMINPKFRNVASLYYGVLQSAGMAGVGIIGQYLHWKTIAWIMLIPIVLALVNCSLLWPESPPWLALKKRFTDCEKSFTWLRGTGVDANKELAELLCAKTAESHTDGFFKIVVRKDFYKPIILMFILLSATYWSGSAVIIIYSTELLKKTSNSIEIVYYGGIILNITVFVAYNMSAVLIKQFNNKTVAFRGGIAVILSAIFCSIITLLQHEEVLDNSVLPLIGLILHMIADVGCFALPCYAIAVEIVPVKHRGLGGALYIIFMSLFHSSSLKAAPYMFLSLNIWGTFLFYAMYSLIICILIWKYLPETKNRTLQELEDYFNAGEFVPRNVDGLHNSIGDGPEA